MEVAEGGGGYEQGVWKPYPRRPWYEYVCVGSVQRRLGQKIRIFVAQNTKHGLYVNTCAWVRSSQLDPADDQAQAHGTLCCGLRELRPPAGSGISEADHG